MLSVKHDVVCVLSFFEEKNVLRVLVYKHSSCKLWGLSYSKQCKEDQHTQCCSANNKQDLQWNICLDLTAYRLDLRVVATAKVSAHDSKFGIVHACITKEIHQVNKAAAPRCWTVEYFAVKRAFCNLRKRGSVAARTYSGVSPDESEV